MGKLTVHWYRHPDGYYLINRGDGWVPQREAMKGQRMSVWESTKEWVKKNRTISGALAGGAAGSIVPGLGTVVGAIVGAGVGYASAKEAAAKDDAERIERRIEGLPPEAPH